VEVQKVVKQQQQCCHNYIIPRNSYSLLQQTTVERLTHPVEALVLAFPWVLVDLVDGTWVLLNTT
jgi:hypothetical protein